MAHDHVRDLLQRDIDPELYREIRELWKTHSLAEDRRDIPGLISTLTTDCVYELPQQNARWEGHDGATRFYQQLIGAFPDIRFDLQYIVIGPQGVWEEAQVTGTHQGDWLDHPATGRRVQFTVSIFFPWDRTQQKFRGERVTYYGLAEEQ